ncbi:MAG TPA: adenylate cyclase regulatory domain-containing protein [Acidimicrobiales bacterium]|nr:adenylate cyclase regulatory domain-containing protein [Acidimicrobiales bacterium]
MSDDETTTAQQRAEALARVRALLLELGCTDEDIDRAVADDVVDLLVVDRMMVPTTNRMTQAQVSEQTDIPLETARRFWRALGFLDVGDDDPVFTDMDIEAVQLFQAMVAMGLVDTESAIQMARVIGTAMATVAEAETGPGATPILMTSGDSVLDADAFARQAGTSLPAMARLLEFVWRRHLQAATRRAMLLRARGPDQGISPVVAVGFADMVGFTLLSQHLTDPELAAVVRRFEELSHDIVTKLGGRVVKMIGDEVMFVVESVVDAARIGLDLADAYADDELLSDVRVGLAVGPVLQREGDYFGATVNLAHRIVNIGNPGTVLTSDEFRSALVDLAPDAFTMKPLRPRLLKDLGRVQLWWLGRLGHEADGTGLAADRRRNMRWERLSEVLRDLEELRGVGERLLSSNRPSGSAGSEAGGGNPEGA